MVVVVMLALALVGPAPAPRLPPGWRELVDVQRDAPPVKMDRTHNGWRYRDTKHGFVADIDDEGNVRFRDINFKPFVVLDKEKREIDRARERDESDDDPWRPKRDNAKAGSTMVPVDHGPYGRPPILVGIGFRMPGIADLAIPRSTKAKREFLKATEAWRQDLAAKAERRRIDDALDRLPQQLIAIWYDETRTLAERKAEIFARWDECREDDDSDAGRSGERARRIIEAFIRRHAAAGGAKAFSNDELRRFDDTRHSRQRFSPYRTTARDTTVSR